MPYENDPNQDVRTSIRTTQDVVVGKRVVKTAVVLPVSASNATVMDLSRGDHWTYTPTEASTLSAINHAPGQFVTLTIQATGSSRTLTFGTGFGTTGTLATGTDAAKMFTIVFVSNGTYLNEVARTTALTVS
jgi:hypothetical protein